MPRAMIEYAEALERIISHATLLPKTSLSLEKSSGYVLAANVKASSPIPRFDASAVDGYAVIAADIAKASAATPVTLHVQGTIRAGSALSVTIKPQRAIRIFTGACIPAGADSVVMQEQIQKQDGSIGIASPTGVGENIRPRGEEFKKGETVLKRGTLITPPVAGLLATLGCNTVRVHRKPRVAIIVTGNELRAPKSTLSAGEIYDSNSFALSAALQALGITPVLTLRVKDSKKLIQATFKRALMRADVVISVGGVSVGEYDFVKDVCNEVGIKTIFWRVAIKPGKPNFFGTHGRKLFFGLPGNPVAALLSFHLLARPALQQMMGTPYVSQLHLSAELTANVKKKPGRAEFVRAKLGADKYGKLFVTPTQGQDSNMMGGLAKADCVILFPKDATEIVSGEQVIVTSLQWSQ